ncbi:hypothetical protein GCM10028808_50010 [Spirosoma migulaei]
MPGSGASDLQIAWFIVELQASMISDQNVIIRLQEEKFLALMGLVREKERQIDRLKAVFPLN